jgi:AcrR family transcriptional regulator
MSAVADAVAELFAEGGFEAVSINAVAARLAVSRATLYRTVHTKDDLLGVLFERSTLELTAKVREVLGRADQPREELYELIRLQVDGAVRMRRYLSVFFGGSGLPADVMKRWHGWSREYESLWVATVARAMGAGVLEKADPVVTTRLLLGMCIWVSRWYRPNEPYKTEDIAEAAIKLLRTGPDLSA